jgi:ureidoglycolate lyase
MSTSVNIRPEPLTKEVFRPYGDVLETDGVPPRLINFGNTQKFGNLADVTLGDNGTAQLSIYRSSAIVVPFRILLMECHPLGSQAFYPLHQRPFPVVVARAGEAPAPGDIRVFLTNGRQGVNLHAGVWHHYQLTLGQDSEYLVVERGGNGDNYREHRLSGEVWMDI